MFRRTGALEIGRDVDEYIMNLPRGVMDTLNLVNAAGYTKEV